MDRGAWLTTVHRVTKTQSTHTNHLTVGLISPCLSFGSWCVLAGDGGQQRCMVGTAMAAMHGHLVGSALARAEHAGECRWHVMPRESSVPSRPTLATSGVGTPDPGGGRRV